MITMQHHHLRFFRPARASTRRSGERRTAGSHRGVLAAVVALAFCAWVVVVQQPTPELDADIVRQSLAVLDELLAANGSGEH